MSKHASEAAGTNADPGAAISEGIRRSWTDPVIAAKRKERTGVEVDGQYFPSVRQAFLGLGLPMKRHAKVRLDVKAAGAKGIVDDDNRKWVAVPRQKAEPAPKKPKIAPVKGEAKDVKPKEGKQKAG